MGRIIFHTTKWIIDNDATSVEVIKVGAKVKLHSLSMMSGGTLGSDGQRITFALHNSEVVGPSMSKGAVLLRDVWEVQVATSGAYFLTYYKRYDLDEREIETSDNSVYLSIKNETGGSAYFTSILKYEVLD